MSCSECRTEPLGAQIGGVSSVCSFVKIPHGTDHIHTSENIINY